MTDSKVTDARQIEAPKEVEDINEEKVLFEWVAADRAFQKKRKRFLDHRCGHIGPSWSDIYFH